MKKYITLVFATVAALNAYAQQDTLNAVVQVENDYAPVVVKANKISSTPRIEMPGDYTPIDIVFSQNGKPYGYFLSSRDIREVLPGKEKTKPGYARLGYGLNNNIDAKLAYSIIPCKNGNLNFAGSLNGFKTDVKGVAGDWNSRFYNAFLSTRYTHSFKKFAISVAADASNKVFNYQTAPITIASDKQHSNRYHIAAGIESKTMGAFSYKGEIGYAANTRKYSSGMKDRITENHLSAKGEFAYEFIYGNFEKLGADIAIDGLFYNSTLRPQAVRQYNNYTSIRVNPYMNLRFNEWTIRAGVHYDMLTANGAFIAIAPDCSIEGELKENMRLNVSVTGGRTLNTFDRLEQESPYWNYTQGDGQHTATYTIADFNATLRLTYSPFTIWTYAGYAYTKDDLLPYIHNGNELISTKFTTATSRKAYIGVMAGYDYNGWLNFTADARYNNWNCSGSNNLIMFKPMINANIEADARLYNNIYATLGYSYVKYAKGNDARIDDKNMLNAKISYRFHKQISVYLQGYNLLNSKYQLYPAYFDQGAAVIAGASVNF